MLSLDAGRFGALYFGEDRRIGRESCLVVARIALMVWVGWHGGDNLWKDGAVVKIVVFCFCPLFWVPDFAKELANGAGFDIEDSGGIFSKNSKCVGIPPYLFFGGERLRGGEVVGIGVGVGRVRVRVERGRAVGVLRSAGQKFIVAML